MTPWVVETLFRPASLPGVSFMGFLRDSETIVNPKSFASDCWPHQDQRRGTNDLHSLWGFDRTVRHRQSAGACSRMTISLGILHDGDGRPEIFRAVPNEESEYRCGCACLVGRCWMRGWEQQFGIDFGS